MDKVIYLDNVELEINRMEELVRRCPCCDHLSMLKVGGHEEAIEFEPASDYFICQNYKCSVERIYPNNVVMVSSSKK